MTSRSSASSGPGLRRMSSGIAILPTSCIALARRSSSASSGAQPGRERELVAQARYPLDVLAGLLVARLDGLAEPLDDLQLGRAQLARALAHLLLEQVVDLGDPLALDVSSRLLTATVATEASASAASGPACGEHGAVLEGELRDRDVGERRARGAASAATRAADAQRQQRHRRASEQDQQRVQPGGRGRSGQPVQRGPDRVRLDLGTGHQLAARRRGVQVVQRRRGRADRRPRLPRSCRVDLAGQQRGERVGRDRAGRARGSRSARRRAERARARRAARAARRPSRRASGSPHLGRRSGGSRRRASSGRLLAAARAPIALEVLVAAEHARAAVPVGLRRGQHGAAGAADRVVEREVLAVRASAR